MGAGRLRRADPLAAAHHFFALLTAETQHHWFLRDQPARTRPQIKATVERALAAFAGGYRV